MTPPRNTLALLISATFLLIGVVVLFKAHDAAGIRIAFMSISFFGGCGVVGLARALEDRGAVWRRGRRAVDRGRAVFAVRRTYFALMAAGAALMTCGAAAALDASGSPRPLLWAAIALFGPGAALLAIWSADRSQIVIDADGVFDTRLTMAPIPWPRIVRIAPIQDWRRVAMIAVEVDDQAFLREIARRRGKASGGVRLSTTTLDGGFDDVADALRRFAPDPALIFPDEATGAGADDDV